MSEIVKAASIVAAAIIVATVTNLYFSPYQSCVRAFDGMNLVERGRIVCAKPNSN